VFEWGGEWEEVTSKANNILGFDISTIFVLKNSTLSSWLTMLIVSDYIIEMILRTNQ
jgi:hypothetical protein